MRLNIGLRHLKHPNQIVYVFINVQGKKHEHFSDQMKLENRYFLISHASQEDVDFLLLQLWFNDAHLFSPPIFNAGVAKKGVSSVECVSYLLTSWSNSRLWLRCSNWLFFTRQLLFSSTWPFIWEWSPPPLSSFRWFIWAAAITKVELGANCVLVCFPNVYVQCVAYKQLNRLKRIALPCPFCIMREDSLEIKQHSEIKYMDICKEDCN